MASVATTPKRKTSPVVWVAIVAAAAAAFILTAPSDTSSAATSTAKKTSKSRAKDDGLYTEADRMAKFASITTPVADVFNPLVKKPILAVKPPTQPADPATAGSIDLRLTGGEAGWYYTGLVELDGKRQALLENTKTGETMYVSAGEGWKAARVSNVDIEAVVLIGPDGTSARIPISQYGVAPGANPATAVATTKPSTQPLNVPSGITGQIGGGSIRPVPGTATMTLPDGRTVQVPYDPNNANGQGGGRRRNRRNNQNQGNFYGP
ncbi:hypothetical protein EON82_04675 [bacterium]|nr:MAG: hypothetical protein EON82_04675 [bacterium]